MGGRGASSNTEYYGIGDSIKRQKYKFSQRREMKELEKTTDAELEEAIGKQGKPIRMWEALDSANPFYDAHDIARSNNCIKCVVAYDMMRRGYDVQALVHTDDDDITTQLVPLKMLYGAKAYSLNTDKLEKSLEKRGKKLAVGDRAAVLLGIMRNGIAQGHAVVVEKTDSGYMVIDPQIGEATDFDYYRKNGTIVEALMVSLANKPTNAVIQYVRKKNGKR